MGSVTALLHKLFIPKESNKFRARVLHVDFLTVYLLLAVFFTFNIKHSASPEVLGYATDISAAKLFSLTNQEREKYNLSSLTYNDKLAQAASEKAKDMFAKNYWAHFAPDGKSPWDFILAANYSYEYAGENLAKNFLFSQGVVDAWMNSKTHRENILRPQYTEIGFAVVNGILNSEQTTLVVQMFGKPSLSPIVNNIHNNPSISPEQIQNSSLSGPAVLSQESKQQSTLPHISYNVSFIFMMFLLVALIIDFYFASKMNLTRLHSKNLAHIIFIVFILVGLIILSRGAIG